MWVHTLPQGGPCAKSYRTAATHLARKTPVLSKRDLVLRNALGGSEGCSLVLISSFKSAIFLFLTGTRGRSNTRWGSSYCIFVGVDPHPLPEFLPSSASHMLPSKAIPAIRFVGEALLLGTTWCCGCGCCCCSPSEKLRLTAEPRTAKGKFSLVQDSRNSMVFLS